MASPHPTLLLLARGDELPADLRVTTALVDSAAEHGVAPLLDEAVRDHGLDGDHDALVQLAMHSLESAADTRAAFEVLGTLLDAGDSLGIDIAVFKGLAIGSRWYPRPELRPANDIDVFVDPDQVDRLGELVERFAAKPGSRETVEGMVAEGRVFEYSLVVDRVAVDLHIDPMNLVVSTRQQQLLWEHTEMIPISDGRTARTLDLELTIVQSLLSLLRDNFADLLHLYDVTLMLDNDPDWDFIEAFVEAEGWTDIVRFSLGFVCDAFERPSPLPRDISISSRMTIGRLWPNRILLEGSESIVRSPRRQSMASLLIAGRRFDVTGAMLQRIFPSRSVIDDRFAESAGPYPVALYRWRRSQQAEAKRFKARAGRTGGADITVPTDRTMDTGAHRETI